MVYSRSSRSPYGYQTFPISGLSYTISCIMRHQAWIHTRHQSIYCRTASTSSAIGMWRSSDLHRKFSPWIPTTVIGLLILVAAFSILANSPALNTLFPPLAATTSLAPKKSLFAAFVFATKNNINDMRYSHFFTLLIYYL